MKNLETDQQNLQTKYTNIEKEKKNVEAVLQKARDQIKTFEKEKKEFQEKYTEMEKQKMKIDTDLTTTRDQVKKFEKEKEELQRKYYGMKKENKSLATDLKITRDKMSELEKSSEGLVAKCNDFENENKTLHKGLNAATNTDRVLDMRSIQLDSEKPHPIIVQTEVGNSRYERDLRILLVGHCGHGKSATGNTLLGQEAFPTRRAWLWMRQSVTQSTQIKVANRFGRTIHIVDTPGFFDNSHDDSFVYSELRKCIDLTFPGFNAICFVMKPDRITQEVNGTFDMFLSFFGEGVDDFAFVVLTYMGNEDVKNKYLESDDIKKNPKLQQLIKRCQGKVLIIDNNKYIPQNEKQTMARRIINKIGEENSKRTKSYFTMK
ncbi:hypothetical protein DPMN_094103 [Dreissena polymorpha]|uniref:AIG1-type G domain-containing protein n=1 Tax=Dreissena polymorpha TaxID=45954 RepID=A0A9D4L709_DREPO|nr:hypothetical protein DPMN_094103 [Dreissena polymorpha]